MVMAAAFLGLALPREAIRYPVAALLFSLGIYSIVLLWDKRLSVPSNLVGLYRCEFEGSELSWTAGMKLMKAIRGFKTPAPS
jgi:hypothetical protein